MEILFEPASDAWELQGAGASPSSPCLSREGSRSGPTSDGPDRQGDSYFDTRWSHTAKYLRDLASRKAVEAEQIRRQRSAVPVLGEDEPTSLPASPFISNPAVDDADGALHMTAVGKAFPCPPSLNSPLRDTAMGGGRGHHGDRLLPNKSPIADLLLMSSGSAPADTAALDTLLESVLQRSTAVSSKLVESIALPSEKEKLKLQQQQQNSKYAGSGRKSYAEAHVHGNSQRNLYSRSHTDDQTGERGSLHSPSGSPRQDHRQRPNTAAELPRAESSRAQHPQHSQHAQLPPHNQYLQESPDAHPQAPPLPALLVHRYPHPPSASGPPSIGASLASPLSAGASAPASASSPQLSPLGWASNAFGSVVPAAPHCHSTSSSGSSSDAPAPGRGTPPSRATAAEILRGTATPRTTEGLPPAMRPPPLQVESAAADPATDGMTDEDEEGVPAMSQAPVSGGKGRGGDGPDGSSRQSQRTRKAPTSTASFHLPPARRTSIIGGEPAATAAASRRRSISTSSDSSNRPAVVMRPNSPVYIPTSPRHSRRVAQPARDGPNSCPAIQGGHGSASSGAAGGSGTSGATVHLPQLGQPGGNGGGLRPSSSYYVSGGGAGTSGHGKIHFASSVSYSRHSHDSGGESLLGPALSPSGEESVASGLSVVGIPRRASFARGQSKLREYLRSSVEPSGLMSPPPQSPWAKSTTTRELVYTRF